MEMRGLRRPAFLLGFLALSWQILLMREFSAHFFGNEVVFGVLLAAWLFWTGLGSILATRFRFSALAMSRHYFWIILAFPLCLAGIRFSRFITGALPGENLGLLPAGLFAMVVSGVLCIPLGSLFVFNTWASSGRLSHVYLWEAIGSAAAGLFIYYVMIPRLSNWQAAAVVGAGASVLVHTSHRLNKKHSPLLFISLLMMAGLWLTDFPSQQRAWQPFTLVDSRDSAYGKLQMLQDGEQLTLYSNSEPVFMFPDPAASEEAVHFAMLQRPQAQRVLLIGGGVGGNLGQLLKFPVTRVDYVEPDPLIIEFSRKHLPSGAQQPLDDGRVHIHHLDGRVFLEKNAVYDVILLDLPDPSNAQLNRFYTLEFFQLVSTRLRSDGLFSFRVSSSENYISPALQGFLSSLYATLTGVFQEVKVIPGSTNIFLASQSPIQLNPQALLKSLASLGIDNQYIHAGTLPDRLSPLRIETLGRMLREDDPWINRDLFPISYFFSAVLWSNQFHGLESRVFSVLARLDKHRLLLDIPLGIFVLTLAMLSIRPTRSRFLLVPLAVMGFTTIVCEVTAIFAFQIHYGSLYHNLALLFSAFMLGIALGAWRSTKRPKYRLSQIPQLQGFFCLIVLGLNVAVQLHPPLAFFILFLWGLGYLGGDLFVISNQLFIQQRTNYGLGYGLDLIGSFVGALLASSLLFPLVGLVPLTQYLFLANSFCFLFLIYSWRKA